MTIPAFPLTWPDGWGRLKSYQRKRATFTRNKRELTIADAVTRVREELGRMSILDDDLVVSTNLELRMDGWPKSGQREPADPGAAVYWRDKAKNTRCMAIDRYDRVADNLAAIAATLDAMRAIERHGGAEILNRAFTGFVEIENSSAHWSDVLGTSALSSRAEIDAAYKRLRSQHHPDKGGDAEMFNRIQQAYAEATSE
ncbi:DnaJ-class molecular chaperone [Rhodanobacter fulvus Jip2]|uniref:DnaJ-class molecular chaperone n=1 Tax=Rhodanobacter fulvus Jip2 TaxID=1163408 RepID=I4VMZ2_9GAMM|nr:DnaJ domain-containing protein [Rhodanobacter fulvus]EIL88583.1 DnaJ-class molecular chaperone [Rhodanobacter fulvus Jip2]